MLQTILVWFFQGANDKWQASVTKKNGSIYLRSPYEDVERSCGVTLIADDVFQKILLEKGTADECEHTVARRIGEVNSALETCGFATKCWKIGDPAQSPVDGRKSKVLEKQAGVPDKGFPPLSGHCVSCHAIDGR